MAIEGIVRVGTAMPKDTREWERFLRNLNEAITFNGVKALLTQAMTVANREGTTVEAILQRITDAGTAADQRFLPQVSAGNVLSLQNVNPLVASADATVATISIAAHTLQYGFGTVSYNSGTITGLLPSTNYFVYADDPNYAGGAVTYLATTNRTTVTASNGRYFVGGITTAISANTAAIVDATSTNPVEFETGTNHGWTTGDTVTLTDLPDDFGTALNGNDYVITVIDPTHFSVAVDGSGFIAYTTGGLAARVSQALAGGAGGGGGWVDDYYYA